MEDREVKKETKDNIKKFMAMVEAVDPELFEIKVALTETRVNPVVLPQIIRALANLFYGTGHGKIQIFMQGGKITSVNPEERMKIDVEAVLMEEPT